MKICVLNLSGNVGKSTLAVHLLAAFTPGARIVSVESINASAANEVEGLDVEELSASRFKEIFREIMLGDDVIVDVGASNVAAFMSEMKRFKSAVGEFDLVLVPTVPADKQQRDTIATIDWLHELGLDGRKVRVVFNQYATDALDPVEVVYAQVLGYAAADGKGKAVYRAARGHRPQRGLSNWPRSRARPCANSQARGRLEGGAPEAKRAGDMEALERAMSGQMTHDLAVTAQQNLARVHGMLFPKGSELSAQRGAPAPEAPASRKRA